MQETVLAVFPLEVRNSSLFYKKFNRKTTNNNLGKGVKSSFDYLFARRSKLEARRCF